MSVRVDIPSYTRHLHLSAYYSSTCLWLSESFSWLSNIRVDYIARSETWTRILLKWNYLAFVEEWAFIFLFLVPPFNLAKLFKLILLNLATERVIQRESNKKSSRVINCTSFFKCQDFMLKCDMKGCEFMDLRIYRSNNWGTSTDVAIYEPINHL